VGQCRISDLIRIRHPLIRDPPSPSRPQTPSCCLAPPVLEMATAQHHPPRYVLLVTLAAVTVMSAEPSTAKPIRGCERPYSPSGKCECEWEHDETGQTTYNGLQGAASMSAAQVAAAGLKPEVVKAADQSPEACELVCCLAKEITSGATPTGASPKKGPCGLWQWHHPEGCWIGLGKGNGPTQEVLPTRSTDGANWVGGSGNKGEKSAWGWPFIVTLLVCTTLYLAIGMTYNLKVRAVPMGKGIIPQRELWSQLGGLVLDGVLFSKAKTASLAGRAMGARAGSAGEQGGAGLDDSLVASAAAAGGSRGGKTKGGAQGAEDDAPTTKKKASPLRVKTMSKHVEEHPSFGKALGGSAADASVAAADDDDDDDDDLVE
jgi:hypothetical protein